jgi:hypothetical protein
MVKEGSKPDEIKEALENNWGGSAHGPELSLTNNLFADWERDGKFSMIESLNFTHL